MKSNMTHMFSQVPAANIPRSTFKRDFKYKAAFDADYLIPFYWDEAYPGDTFKFRMNFFARMATPIYPLMDNLRLDTFFFEVPIRQIWENWQKFNGEQENPGDSTDYLVPTLTAPAEGFAESSIYDYMGLPTGAESANLEVSALPLRAYYHIYNEWFRDQNLQISRVFSKGDGPDTPENYFLLRRGKRHDYFSSALPWPQKDNQQPVTIPLGDTAPIQSTGTFRVGDGTQVFDFNRQSGGPPGNWYDNAGDSAGSTIPVQYTSGIETDLSMATAATINQLRQAFQIQKMYERDARGGTRYYEVVLSHFGVRSPDLRLQRPGFLGGSSTHVNINPVASTVPTDIGVDPQGTLAAIGTVSDGNHGYTRSFTEHSIVMGILAVTADLTYQNGLDRKWSRRTRFDYYWPSLATIGEQAILNKELEITADEPTREQVFGYQERYGELRYYNSRICGRFKSNSAQSLDPWHAAQDFGGTVPALDSNFIESNTPMERILAIPEEPHFIFDSYVNYICARPMPLYGVPGQIDRF